jgi:hypothetical protein
MGPFDLPVTGVPITSDRIIYITVTSVHHLPATFCFGWPVTSMMHQGHSIVLYICLKYHEFDIQLLQFRTWYSCLIEPILFQHDSLTEVVDLQFIQN